MDYPDSSGQTTRAKLKNFARLSGITDPRLSNPTLPPEIGCRVWNAFKEINRSRHTDSDGRELPTTHLELQAWCALMDEHLSPWEVTAFMTMDSAYLDEARTKRQG